MHALHIHAGPVARKHLDRHGLSPDDVAVVPAAAGGPKGLILGPLDRFLFGYWLARGRRPVDLVGASIGAWRMAAACLPAPVAAFEALEHGYIHEEMKAPPGRRLPAPEQVSAAFAANLRRMFAGQETTLLSHPRYRLHVMTTRGRHLLAREGRLRTPIGYLGAALTNLGSRRALGAWVERVVFSSTGPTGQPWPLPFATRDYRTRQVALTPANFHAAMQASGSIPFVLRAVHDIAGAPRGAYWDGGITDYHLHLDYFAAEKGAAWAEPASPDGQKGMHPGGGLVLYPHFQQAVVPGWLDKALAWRHRATPFLDRMVLLAPNPDWVRTLPGAKLPSRQDLTRLGASERVRAWRTAVQAARQLAEEFEAWLARPDPARVQPL